MSWLPFIVFGFLAFLALAIYNKLVKLRMAAQAAWVDVHVQLERRHIPPHLDPMRCVADADGRRHLTWRGIA